jgi:DNA-binding NarL/FixJ family response regulator
MTSGDSRPAAGAAGRAQFLVLIVVGSAPLRSAICQCVRAQAPELHCIEAAGCDEALGIARALTLDLVLVDFELTNASTRGGDGAGLVIDGLRQLNPATEIHLLTEPHHRRADAAAIAGVTSSLCKDHLYDGIGSMLAAFRAARAV